MIERVAGCLEYGGRGLLRAPKKPYRSRRDLHSAFWSHGANNIDLPAWWKFLLQTNEPERVLPSGKRRRTTTQDAAAGLQEIFLDFLYPVQTHALIRRLRRATNTHRQAAQLAQQGSRKYTSIAEDLILTGRSQSAENSPQQEEVKSTKDDIASQEEVLALHKRAAGLLERLGRPEHYDDMWMVQKEALEAGQPLDAAIIKRIFYALSTSKRTIDLERSLAIFETIDNKSSLSYNKAVNAALGLKDVDTAVNIHAEAIIHIPGSIDIGTPNLLKYALQNRQWRLAVDIWYRLWQTKFLYFSVQRDLWKEVDSLNLQDLLFITEAAADFALSMPGSANPVAGDCPNRDAAAAARDFVLAMTERVFESRGTSFGQAQYLRLLGKIKTLDNASTKFSVLALRQLLSLDDAKAFEATLDVYRGLRQDASFAPSKNLLQDLFSRIRNVKSSVGVSMILEDWRKYEPTRIAPKHYLMSARILAGNGQADAMENLLSCFLTDYPPNDALQLTRTKIFNYMLWVHMKRADTRAVLQSFNNLQKQHGFVPNTISHNFVIMTFARVGDVENAMKWFENLKKSTLTPNHHTFSSLISMVAKRGDIDAVQSLLQELRSLNMDPDISMIDALVVVHVKNERYKDAEAVLQQALKMDLRGSRTHMWNIVMNAYALRAELEKVHALHGRMHKAGVPEDQWTYAALLSSLTVSGNAHSARGVMKHVMPRLGMEVTALHYAIVMGGYLKIKDYSSVFVCYREMLERKLAPDMSIQNIVLRAAARTDKKETRVNLTGKTDFTRAREVLDMTLQQLNPAQLAAAGPRNFLGADPVDEAFTSTYYEYMIFLYGMDGSFAKVTELYDQYIATAKKFGQLEVENSPAMMMLTALLTAHRRAGNDEEVDRCWYLALDKLEKLSKRSNANLAEPGWVLPARRFLINVPLRQYMKHLGDRGRFDDMINVVKDLRWAGYELHSPKWNDYIQYLASSPEPRHRYLAFKVCEHELMKNWPGWLRLASSGLDNRSGGSWWHMKRALKRENRNTALLTFKRVVQYRTLVMLTGVYVDATGGYGGGRGEVSRSELAAVAPKTVDAVRSLPKIEDQEQLTFLHRD